MNILMREVGPVIEETLSVKWTLIETEEKKNMAESVVYRLVPDPKR